MENENHRGSEYNNIIETWEKNEKNKPDLRTDNTTVNETPEENTLEQTIKKEATEYDNVNKEERVLGGDRATLNDDEVSHEK